jgi:phage replication O-like protein O
MPDFEGFYTPRFTQVPNTLFDELLPELGLGELKVLLYIMRRTFGFHKDADRISLHQIEAGTGLSRKSISAAVSSLEEKGMVLVARSQGDDGVHGVNTYSLRLAEGSYAATPPPRGVVTLSNQGREVSSPGVGEQGNIQKNEEINIERDDIEQPSRTPEQIVEDFQLTNRLLRGMGK